VNSLTQKNTVAAKRRRNFFRVKTFGGGTFETIIYESRYGEINVGIALCGATLAQALLLSSASAAKIKLQADPISSRIARFRSENLENILENQWLKHQFQKEVIRGQRQLKTGK